MVMVQKNLLLLTKKVLSLPQKTYSFHLLWAYREPGALLLVAVTAVVMAMAVIMIITANIYC